MGNGLREALESLRGEIIGLVRRRRLFDEVDERLAAFEAGMKKALRRAE